MTPSSHLLLFLLLAFPSLCFPQDPSCEFVVSLENIDVERYDYQIIIEYDHEKESIETLQQQLENRWDVGLSPTVKTSLLTSATGKQLLIGYLSDYCYPGLTPEDQLRIVIARREKATQSVALMYAVCGLRPGRTEIIISEFKSGQRETEVFSYEQAYWNTKNVDYGYVQNLVLRARRIYID